MTNRSKNGDEDEKSWKNKFVFSISKLGSGNLHENLRKKNLTYFLRHFWLNKAKMKMKMKSIFYLSQERLTFQTKIFDFILKNRNSWWLSPCFILLVIFLEKTYVHKKPFCLIFSLGEKNVFLFFCSYSPSLAIVFKWIQFNCPSQLKVCFLVPKLFHFPLKLFCWYSMVRANIFFLVNLFLVVTKIKWVARTFQIVCSRRTIWCKLCLVTA